MAPINDVTITIALLTAIVLVLFIIYSFKENDEPTWSPLLPESKKREWNGKGHRPIAACPRCNSLNSEHKGSDIKTSCLLPTNSTLHYRCRYCGYEWSYSKHRGIKTH